MTALDTSPAPALLGEPLSPRERVVLAEIADGETLAEIADRLYVSRNTVKSQLRAVYRKIGVSTRPEAVAWARAAGLRPSSR